MGGAISKSLVLSYRRDGKRVLSIKDYYTDKIAPLASKYSRYSFSRGNTVVCPFHVDNDPSFGVLLDRNGKERYNCFGCGVTGDFLDFYKAMNKTHFGRFLSDDVALEEICSQWGIPLDDVSQVGNGLNRIAEERSRAYKEIENLFTEADYLRELRKASLLGKGIGVFNGLLIRYIAENYQPAEDGA